MKQLMISLVIAVLSAVGSFADLLVKWNDDGVYAAGNGGFDANPVWNNTTAVTGIDGAATVARLDETKFSSSYYGNTSVMTYQLQNDTSINLDKYVQVFVAPDSGYSLTLSEFSFNLYSTLSGAQNVAVRSSVDEFASDLMNTSLTRGSHNRLNINLSSVSGFSDVDSSVEFRIYIWNAQGFQTAYLADSGTGDTQNAIQISGTVPEPATAGLLGLAAGVSFLMRRWVRT